MPISKHRRKGNNRPKHTGLFMSEKVIAKASITVQELIQGYLSKPGYSDILNNVRSKKYYTRLSDAKKKQKWILAHRIARLPITRTKQRRTN